jgi:DNA replication protein DnaD
MRPGEVRTKITRTVFSRDEARRNIDKSLLPQLEALFKKIDETDLIINFYDLAHNKRKNPPRDELLERFNKEEQDILQAKAEKLSQYQYLKLRHLLVDLR